MTARLPATVRYAARLARYHLRQARAFGRLEGDLMSHVNVVVDDPACFLVGRGSSIAPFTEINVSGHPSAPHRKGLFIGERVTVGAGCNLRGAGGVITIGDGVLIGQQVSIIAANHSFDPDKPVRDQPWAGEPVDVTIEDDVFIGCGAQIMPGTIIRRGAVVAAGSLARGEIPEYAIFAGVPARQVGSRRDGEWHGADPGG